MAAVTDPEEAMKLHAELQAIEEELAAAEDQWLALQEEAAD
jgi:predicted  nucleic acid-binding Zn-ribbon protein